jgi:23S rRNA pseudouridine1911/1915/1917 synthase
VASPVGTAARPALLCREAGLSRPEDEAVNPPLKLLVPPALDTERVDRALALLAGLSRAEASRMIAEGRVRVGEKPVSAGSRRLRSGELLEMERPVTEPGAPAHPVPEAGGPAPAIPQAAVVYADEDLVVVDKPAGLVVHPGAGNREGTLVQQLVGLFPDISGAGPAGERPGIVQRLDKGTSGLLVVARAPAAREALVAQLAAHSMERRYLAVVHGQIEADEGLIEAPLGRSPGERLRMAVVEGGRYARTHYLVKARSGVPLPVTLVSCRLETGRTHQVRAHFAAIGHPVFGDEQYSKPSQLAAARAVAPALRRPWLHAELLGFVHPTTGQKMSFSSELPPELAETLLTLGLEGPAGARHED